MLTDQLMLPRTDKYEPVPSVGRPVFITRTRRGFFRVTGARNGSPGIALRRVRERQEGGEVPRRAYRSTGHATQCFLPLNIQRANAQNSYN